METKATLWLGPPGITDSQNTVLLLEWMNSNYIFPSLIPRLKIQSPQMRALAWFEKVRLGMVIHNLTNIACHR